MSFLIGWIPQLSLGFSSPPQCSSYENYMLLFFHAHKGHPYIFSTVCILLYPYEIPKNHFLHSCTFFTVCHCFLTNILITFSFIFFAQRLVLDSVTFPFTSCLDYMDFANVYFVNIAGGKTTLLIHIALPFFDMHI